MSRIRKCFDVVERIPKKFDSDIEFHFRKTYDEKGNAVYKKDREFSVNSYVNSFKNSTSLEAMLERCALMSARDKLIYLNSSQPGFTGDFSDIPTDLTDAYMRLNAFKDSNPDMFKRIMAGESFESITKSIIENANNSKEVNDNGKTESSDE